MAIIKAGTARTEVGKPDDPLGEYVATLISDTAGLTQFGAFIEELAPGSASSHQHWHATEDEMVFILSGEVTLIENDTETRLTPGDAACWQAGQDHAHCLQNRGDSAARYFVVGTRAPQDRVTYPALDRVLVFDRTTGDRRYTTLDGTPAENPFKT